MRATGKNTDAAQKDIEKVQHGWPAEHKLDPDQLWLGHVCENAEWHNRCWHQVTSLLMCPSTSVSFHFYGICFGDMLESFSLAESPENNPYVTLWQLKTSHTSQSSKGKKVWNNDYRHTVNEHMSAPNSNQQSSQKRLCKHMCTLADNEDDIGRHTPPTFEYPSVCSLPSLLFSFGDMTPCLGLPDKLSFYQSAVMPLRQTLSAQRLAGLRLPIASPLLPFFCSLVLPTLCQQKASIPPSLLSYCTLSAWLSLCLTSSVSAVFLRKSTFTGKRNSVDVHYVRKFFLAFYLINELSMPVLYNKHVLLSYSST